MKSWKIDRRTMLKGAGGVALALPFLDVMADSKKERRQSVWPVCSSPMA